MTAPLSPLARRILGYAALLVAATVFFLSAPGVDLWVSGLFYSPGDGFALGRTLLPTVVHEGMPYLLTAAVVASVAWLAWNRWGGRPIGAFGPRAFAFVLLSLVLGPGLLANVVLKDQWGRARPSQIVEFGGSKLFTPAPLMAAQCERNCSFVAGDPSGGFFFLSLALLATRRRKLAVAGAIGLGAAIGVVRIIQGGHFFSDVIFSGLLVGGLIWALYGLMMVPGGFTRARDALRDIGRTRSGRWITGALLLVFVIAIGVAAIDRPVAHWARSLDSGVHRFFRIVTEFGISTGYLVATFLLALALRICSAFGPMRAEAARWRSWAYAPLFVFAAVAISGIFNSLLKWVFGRVRPKLYFLEGRYGIEGFHGAADLTSLPSGHTVTAFALAFAMTRLWPRLWPIAYAFAVLIAASRVIVTAHWLSDTIAGAVVGTMVARYVQLVFDANGFGPRAAVTGQAAFRPKPHLIEAFCLPICLISVIARGRACFRSVTSLPFLSSFKG